MNTSARMESTCPPDSIQVSADTYRQLSADSRANLHPTGGIDVKGKGMMFTYATPRASADSEGRRASIGMAGVGGCM